MPPYVTLAYWKRIPADWTYTCTITAASSSKEVRICADSLGKNTIITLSAGEVRTVKVPSVVYIKSQIDGFMYVGSNAVGCTLSDYNRCVTMTSENASFTANAYQDGPIK